MPTTGASPSSSADGGTADSAALHQTASDAGPPDANDARSDAGSPVDAGGDVDAAPVTQPSDPLDAHLLHRYTFDGSGSTAFDGAGDADATLVGATLDGTGSVSLAGGLSGPHVTLPRGLISGLESVTVETWLTWSGTGGFQRVFDFGNSTSGAGAQGYGTRHFSLALNAGGDEFRLVFDVDPDTGSKGWRSIYSAPAITIGEVHQVVAVFDRGANEIRLYVDGARRSAAAVPTGEALSQIDDENNWLGMAQWSADPNLQGTLHDVRLYGVPLTDEDVSRRFQVGYD